MMIDEQNMSNKAAAKVLGKVNLVNDWAKRLKEELERKPTVDELADNPTKRWDTLITTGITAMCSGIVGYVLSTVIK